MPYTDVLTVKKTRQRSKIKVQIPRKPTEDDLYPDSDGKPMGETGFHVRAIMSLYAALCYLFRNASDVYVAADMFLYYKEGAPKANKSPDVMVIKGVPNYERRSFKIWQERATPCVIFEITSKSTKHEDLKAKMTLYADLQVREYFVFDPLHEYLEPPLMGWRLHDKKYAQIAPDADGALFSEEVGARLKAVQEFLCVINPLTGKIIPTLHHALMYADEIGQRTEEANQRAEQEAQRAEEERRRAEIAEAEVARLKMLLEKK